MKDRPWQGWLTGWGGTAHLSDASLLDLHTRRLVGDVETSERRDAHARECAPCAAALGDLDRSLAGMTRQITTAADTLISAERLARQLDMIDRRLDGQQGRLLRFPRQARALHIQQPLRRWVAMAAVCGLLFGVAAGRLLGPPATSDGGRSGNWPGAATRGQQGAATLEPALADENLLGEVDDAIARTMHREFRVLDELTPVVSVSRGRR